MGNQAPVTVATSRPALSAIPYETLLLDTLCLLYVNGVVLRQLSMLQTQHDRQTARSNYLEILAARGHVVRAAMPRGRPPYTEDRSRTVYQTNLYRGGVAQEQLDADRTRIIETAMAAHRDVLAHAVRCCLYNRFRVYHPDHLERMWRLSSVFNELLLADGEADSYLPFVPQAYADLVVRYGQGWPRTCARLAHIGPRPICLSTLRSSTPCSYYAGPTHRSG